MDSRLLLDFRNFLSPWLPTVAASWYVESMKPVGCCIDWLHCLATMHSQQAAATGVGAAAAVKSLLP